MQRGAFYLSLPGAALELDHVVIFCGLTGPFSERKPHARRFHFSMFLSQPNIT